MRTHFFLGSTMAPTSSTPRSAGTKRVGSTTPATRTAKRSSKTMVASLSMPYATSARAKNCLTIINSKWTNRSRARSKLRMHAIVAVQIAAAPCLIQVVNADLLEQYTELLEDLQDLAVIARRKNELTIPLAEVKACLRRNGALRR